ncbi:MAG: hypothetical protein VX951_03950 [Planctomycetota bacterium]|nr:hypothetical protein [Planctomycetota bacterium]
MLLVLASLAILLPSVSAQVLVTTEVDYGSDRETNGTFVFATVPSNSSTDLANGLTFKVLAGSPHGASGPISVLTDGSAQKNWDSVPESFFTTDDTTHIRIQVQFASVYDIGQINTFSWHRNSRSRQQYRVYTALAPSNNAPDFTAAAFQDDAALAKLGYTAVASVDTGSHSGGQAGASIDGKIGLSVYVLFDIQPHYLSGVQRSTFHGEIDIVDVCAARTGNYGTGLAGTNGVPTLTTSAPPVFGKSIGLLGSNSSGVAASGLLITGLQSISVPFLGGMLLADTTILTPVAVPVAGFSLPVTIPTLACGLSVYLQALQLDQAAVAGVSMSPGLRLVPGT